MESLVSISLGSEQTHGHSRPCQRFLNPPRNTWGPSLLKVGAGTAQPTAGASSTVGPEHCIIRPWAGTLHWVRSVGLTASLPKQTVVSALTFPLCWALLHKAPTNCS